MEDDNDKAGVDVGDRPVLLLARASAWERADR